MPRPTHSSKMPVQEIKITRKQKAFADHLIENPKDSATEAAAQTYNTTSRGSAAIVAHENLMKPNVQIYLSQHVDKARMKVLELIDSDKDEIALRASDSVLDRALGKATQRTEQISVSLSFGMDLSGVADQE